VDFLMKASSGKIYVNEINTMPGFTSISMFPKMLEYSGISYSTLLDRVIELAMERASSRRELSYSL
jgi:D-alanine-D-alanine ligase